GADSTCAGFHPLSTSRKPAVESATNRRPRPLNLQPRRQQTPAHGHTTHPYAARTLHAVGDLSQTQLRVFLMYSTDETLRMCCQLPAISSAATVHQTIQTVSRELRLILEIPRPAERHFVSFEIGGHRQG